MNTIAVSLAHYVTEELEIFQVFKNRKPRPFIAFNEMPFAHVNCEKLEIY